MARSASKQTIAEASAAPLQAQAVPSPLSDEPQAPSQRHVMIAEAAFYIAQARGFTPSQELDDWLAAEREIEQRLSSHDH
jgi:hypothetical protein